MPLSKSTSPTTTPEFPVLSLQVDLFERASQLTKGGQSDLDKRSRSPVSLLDAKPEKQSEHTAISAAILAIKLGETYTSFVQYLLLDSVIYLAQREKLEAKKINIMLSEGFAMKEEQHRLHVAAQMVESMIDFLTRNQQLQMLWQTSSEINNNNNNNTHRQQFREYPLSGQGNSGFLALGLTRDAVAETLLRFQQDKDVRQSLVLEMKEAFLLKQVNNLPIEQRIEWQPLANDYEITTQKIATIIGQIKTTVSDNAVPSQADDLLAWLEEHQQKETAKLYEQLLHANTVCKIQEDKIHQFLSREDVYLAYVEALRRELWLGYQSALVCAKVPLSIWRQGKKADELVLLGSNTTSAFVETKASPLHLLVTHRLTHLSRLVSVDECQTMPAEPLTVLNQELLNIILSIRAVGWEEWREYVRVNWAVYFEREQDGLANYFEAAYQRYDRVFDKTWPSTLEALQNSQFYVKEPQAIETLLKVLGPSLKKLQDACEIQVDAYHALLLPCIEEEGQLEREIELYYQERTAVLLANNSAGIPAVLRNELDKNKLLAWAGKVSPHYVDQETGNNLIAIAAQYNNSKIYHFLLESCNANATLLNKQSMQARQYCLTDLDKKQPHAHLKRLRQLEQEILQYLDSWYQERLRREKIACLESVKDLFLWLVQTCKTSLSGSHFANRRGEAEDYLGCIQQALRQLPSNLADDLEVMFLRANRGPVNGSQLHKTVETCISHIKEPKNRALYGPLINGGAEMKQRIRDLERTLAEANPLKEQALTEQRHQHQQEIKAITLRYETWLEDAKKSREETEKKVDGLQRENQEIKQENQEIKQENQEIKQENQEIKQENQEIKQENQEIKRGNQEIKQKNQEIKQENQEMKSMLDKLNAQMLEVLKKTGIAPLPVQQASTEALDNYSGPRI